MTGLMHVIARQRKLPSPTFESTGLLERFSTVSTNSGSSWYFASLSYSPSVKAMLEKMAAAPDASAAIYRAGYTLKWLPAPHVDERHFNLLGALGRAITRLLFGTGDEDSIYLITYFLAAGFTWNRFVEVLLNSTAAVLPNATLGSPPSGAWALGKDWVSCHTAVTPNAVGRREARLFQGKLSYPQVSYTVRARNRSFPIYLPAAFSARLGSGPAGHAPHRYVAGSAVDGLEALAYRGAVVPLIDTHHASTSAPGIGPSAYRESAGQLPISGVAAASSAFMGAAALMGYGVGELQALISGDVTPWIASAAGGGRAFALARKLVGDLRTTGVSDLTVGALASAGVHGVIDGGYTDNSGIANAVAAGAGTVTAVTNSNATAALSYLFKDGPHGSEPYQDLASLFPVFASPTAAVAGAAFGQFARLKLPPGSRYLTEVAFGTLPVVTATNVAWGLTAGRRVTLHVISVSSSLSIGEFEAFTHYDALVQELALALVAGENAQAVESTLLPMMGAGGAPARAAEGSAH